MSERDMAAMSHETTGFCFCGQMHGQVKDWNEHDWAALRTHAPAGALSCTEQTNVELEAYLEPSDALIDQGISRLQLHAFLRGDTSDYWNGSTEYPWIRYRAHQIDRNPTPDGNLFRLTHRNIGDTDRTANFLTRADSDEDALVTARMIDQIIDAVIAEYGTDVNS